MRNLLDTNFYMKMNVLQDFHICISVPRSPVLKNFFYQMLFRHNQSKAIWILPNLFF